MGKCADIGLAHDGDADRTICIDEKGNFVLGDKTFTLVEKQMLKENDGGIVVTTVATSQAIYDVAEEYNGEVIATAVGDAPMPSSWGRGHSRAK